ncbi:MAG: PilZ domain-containing protein [Nitrospinae bacterium]|nr:PilZ domain-containing protein [Nitrospinota bacterium]
MQASLREIVLAKLIDAQSVLEDIEQHGDMEGSAIEWQKGYVKALEEMLNFDGLNLRRYPRRLIDVPVDIVRKQRGKGTIIDVSLVGCGLTTPMPLGVGEIVDLFFTLPQQDTPVRVEGRVGRAQHQHEHSSAALEFTALSKHAAEALQAFLTPLPPGKEW